jgi:hypothetical protein
MLQINLLCHWCKCRGHLYIYIYIYIYPAILLMHHMPVQHKFLNKYICLNLLLLAFCVSIFFIFILNFHWG